MTCSKHEMMHPVGFNCCAPLRYSSTATVENMAFTSVHSFPARNTRHHYASNFCQTCHFHKRTSSTVVNRRLRPHTITLTSNVDSDSSSSSTSELTTETSDELASSTKIPGTPCFTRRILSSPMTRVDRSVYLDAITESVDNYLAKILNKKEEKPQNEDEITSNIGQVTLLAPQLDPSLDVYDRRFLLQVTWAIIASCVTTHKLQTRALIQGRRQFGAIPLSVAGLRRHIDADLQVSADDWSKIIRSGDLEDVDDLDDDDDVIIVISPTNAVSIPVIQSVIDVAKRANGRPIIIINPRLTDVPSHSGVMQVSGRSSRISFLQTVQDIFYLRLLYDPGTSYPLRGILYHSFPGTWQVWRSVDVDQDFRLISESPTRPSVSDISDAYKRDSFIQEKEILKDSDQKTTFSDLLAKPQILIPLLMLSILVGAPYVVHVPLPDLFRAVMSSASE